MTNCILNPYKIVWAISVFQNGKSKKEHFSDLARLKEIFKPERGAKVYIITEKQFGMIQFKYDNSEDFEIKKPFTHGVLINEGGAKSFISLSKKQLKNAKQY